MSTILARIRVIINKVPVPLKIILATGLLILLLILSIPQANIQPIEEPTRTITAQAARIGEHRPAITLFGQIESPHLSTLSSSLSAYVDHIYVSEGDFVKTNDELVALEDTDEKLKLTQRQAELDAIDAGIQAENVRYAADMSALEVEKRLFALSEKSAQRYHTLANQKAGSEQQRDEAETNSQKQALSLNARQLSVNDHPNRLKNLEAQQLKATTLRDQAALDLKRAQIRAPFNARITKVYVSPKNRLRPGDPVISLYDTEHIEVRAQIPTRYLAKAKSALEDGLDASAFMDLDGVSIPLKLERIAGAAVQGRGGIDAIFKVKNISAPLELGRTVAIKITLPLLPDTIAIPPQSLHGQNRVYVIEENRLVLKVVESVGSTLDHKGNKKTLIRGNIEDGARIMTTQLANAVGGLKVKEIDNKDG